MTLFSTGLIGMIPACFRQRFLMLIAPVSNGGRTVWFIGRMSSGLIVDQNHTEVYVGPVQNLAISSYTTELWAVVVAIHKSPGPTKVFTDCQTLVRQFNELCCTGKPNSSWSHLKWWHSIADRLQFLNTLHSAPFALEWIPSHLFEHLPEQY